MLAILVPDKPFVGFSGGGVSYGWNSETTSFPGRIVTRADWHGPMGRGEVFGTSQYGLRAPVWSWAYRDPVHDLDLLSHEESYGTLFEVVTGWPRLALVRRDIIDEDPEWSKPMFFDRGIVFATWPSRETRALPLRPLPLGFAINTLIYSLAWLLILTAIPALRRRARIARSRCPACNYDLRGLSSGLCPECGEPAASAGSHT
jgi:hypothetical protein